jgi:hypothetical protein
MPITQPTFSPSDVNISGATNSKITNLALAVAGTEYSLPLQTNLKQLMIKSRGNGVLKIAFTALDTSIKYITIYKGAVLTIDNLTFTGVTLYIQSSVNNDVAEILELY